VGFTYAKTKSGDALGKILVSRTQQEIRARFKPDTYRILMGRRDFIVFANSLFLGSIHEQNQILTVWLQTEATKNF